jgi:hypothetical protein
MTIEEEEDREDISVYQLAETTAGGDPCSDAGAREIAAELIAVRGEIAKLYRAIVSCNYPHADGLVRGLAVRMGFVA